MRQIVFVVDSAISLVVEILVLNFVGYLVVDSREEDTIVSRLPPTQEQRLLAVILL